MHCFEPVSKAAVRLRRVTAGLRGVFVHDVALGDAPGEMEFHINRHSHSSSALRLARGHQRAFPGAREVAVVRVPVRTLDGVLEQETLESPVLLKLDVQGFELRVLRGGRKTLRRVDFVVLEASFRQLYEGEPLYNEVADEMHQLGFRLLRPVGWLTEPRTGEVLQMDALFSRTGATD
jgi:FkbM family methyltransferase